MLIMNKVCIIDEYISSKRNGIGTFLKEYICCLNKMEFSITMIVFNSEYKEFTIENKKGIRYLCFPKFQISSFIDHPEIIDKFFRLYINDSSDNVFCVNHSPCSELLEQIKRSHPLSKIVFTIHDLAWTKPLLGNEQLFRFVVANRIRLSIQKKYQHLLHAFDKELEMVKIVDKVVCLSQSTYRLLLESYLVNTDKVQLIANGLHGHRKVLNSEEKKKLRKEALIEEHEKIILFVGRISEAKGLYALLAAFDSVLKECPHVRLVIAGTSALASFRLPSIAVAARTIFIGHLKPSDLNKWYQIAEIGVISSYTEQCSYVGIEMMMYGLPIIASDGIGVRDMFCNNINAIVAPIETYNMPTLYSRNLANALLKVLYSEELIKKLRNNARKTYKSYYRSSIMQRKYKDFFDDLFEVL